METINAVKAVDLILDAPLLTQLSTKLDASYLQSYRGDLGSSVRRIPLVATEEPCRLTYLTFVITSSPKILRAPTLALFAACITYG